MEETMKCTGQELFNALTQRDMIQIFTGGPAKMAEEAGKDEKFELLGGNVTGKYIAPAVLNRDVCLKTSEY